MYISPFSGNFRFVASCFFFIKISGFYVGYVSSVNLEVLTGHGEGFAVNFAIELLPAIPIVKSTSTARGAEVKIEKGVASPPSVFTIKIILGTWLKAMTNRFTALLLVISA